MRSKLRDLISTMDQHNGMLEHDKEYEGGAEVNIDTEIPDIPDRATISENHKNLIEGLLITEQRVEIPQKKSNCVEEKNRYVLTYEMFLKEGFQKRPPQDPDYDDRPRGWNDNDDEEEE